MEELIASYLILNGECFLPGVGKLLISRRNAVCDVASKLLHPPENNIKFENKGVGDANGFINYVSATTGCSVEEASGEVNNYIGQLRDKLEKKGEAEFPFLGKIVKDNEADYQFFSENSLNIYSPVDAIRVIHEKDTHDVVAGDKVYKSSEMNELLSSTPEKSNRGLWIPALIIFAVALLLIVLFYSMGGFDDHLILQKAPPTYISK